MTTMLKGRTAKRKLTQSMQERGIKMINIRKTRLMTKLALYETGEGREDIR